MNKQRLLQKMKIQIIQIDKAMMKWEIKQIKIIFMMKIKLMIQMKIAFKMPIIIIQTIKMKIFIIQKIFLIPILVKKVKKKKEFKN